MADIQLVETSLRDGNQCLWAALGIDTARTLTIAPIMDQVGFKAIDFTTSTHMGVAVRFPEGGPRGAHSGSLRRPMPKTPLQFMSTGFLVSYRGRRRIRRLWRSHLPHWPAMAYVASVCADPMNDADSNIACARTVKRSGGEYVIAALVFHA